jgi:hypothetical protein
MRIAFNFCKHAMPTCFAEIWKDELSCSLKEKMWKTQKSFIGE